MKRFISLIIIIFVILCSIACESNKEEDAKTKIEIPLNLEEMIITQTNGKGSQTSNGVTKEYIVLTLGLKEYNKEFSFELTLYNDNYDTKTTTTILIDKVPITDFTTWTPFSVEPYDDRYGDNRISIKYYLDKYPSLTRYKVTNMYLNTYT